MDFQDALRAQYFIRSLETQVKEISQVFLGDLSCFLTPLCHQLDQILLPSIAYEIAQAKEEGFLIGKDPESRYQSFFIQNKSFTKRAKDLPKKYPFLFEQIDQTIDQAFSNLKLALARAKEEFPPAAAVELLTASDKHRGTQAIIFTFEDQTKWIYKPRDLRPDVLLNTFISHLNLKPPYDLKTIQTLPRKGYGWVKFQPHLSCESKKDVENYFRRAGVLLAIADTLNYTDGHYENLIANGPYPLIVDGETFFHNYSEKALKEKTAFSTGLIQKVKKSKSKVSFFSAFQAAEKEIYQILYPHCLNERTDSLEIAFHGKQARSFTNLPFIKDHYYVLEDFGRELLSGVQHGYEKIHEHAEKILDDSAWWEMLGRVEARTLKHHTLNYAYLLRRIQQPDACQSKETARKLIEEKLYGTPYSHYEVEDLLNGNIPYFYHYPSDSSFFNGWGDKYSQESQMKSIDLIKQNLKQAPEKKIQTASHIIRNQLGIKKHEASPAA